MSGRGGGEARKGGVVRGEGEVERGGGKIWMGMRGGEGLAKVPTGNRKVLM